MSDEGLKHKSGDSSVAFTWPSLRILKQMWPPLRANQAHPNRTRFGASTSLLARERNKNQKMRQRHPAKEPRTQPVPTAGLGRCSRREPNRSDIIKFWWQSVSRFSTCGLQCAKCLQPQTDKTSLFSTYNLLSPSLWGTASLSLLEGKDQGLGPRMLSS